MIVNLLCDPMGLKCLYDEIIILSATFKTQYDILWSKISNVGVTVYEELDEAVIETIYQRQMGSKKHLLILSDDLDEQWRKMDTKLLNKLVTNSRHCNISMIFLIQKMTMCPTIIRSQADCICAFSACSFAEFESLHREFSVVDKKRFHEMFTMVTNEPYHFLTICVQGGKIRMFDSFRVEIFA